MERVNMKKSKVITILKSLLFAYIVTGLLLLLLALLLYKLDMDESKVAVGIIAIYLVSSFLGGLLAGKGFGTRRFLWGLLAGALYFVILLMMSLASGHVLQMPVMGVVTTLALCLGGGMLGGMVS